MTMIHAFIVSGLICAIGQIMMDVFKLTPPYTMSFLVSFGSLLSGLGLYEPLNNWSETGSSIPITNFGNLLTEGALEGAKQEGFLGIFTGIMKSASAGIAASIIFGFLTACIFGLPNYNILLKCKSNLWKISHFFAKKSI